MKNFRISTYDLGSKAKIYSVFVDGSEEDEFSKFLKVFYPSHKQQIEHLAEKIKEIAGRFGIREIFFKDQGIGAVYRFKNLKDDKTDIRLYCIKWGSNLLILGGGGTKNVRTWQEDPVLSNIVKNLSTIDKFIFENNIDLDEAAKNKTIFELE